MFCTDNLWLREIYTEYEETCTEYDDEETCSEYDDEETCIEYDDEETCTEYDEPLKKKQQRPNGSWRVKGRGHGFETQMAVLIGLRGSKRRDNFRLFFNRDDAGNFVDIVYTAGGRRYFLLKRGELVAALQKCFKTYCDIKRGKDFRDIPVGKTEFIIYTNRKLDPKLSQHTRKQKRGAKKIFKFIPDKIKETGVCTLLVNAVKGIKVIHGSSDGEIFSEFFKKVVLVISAKGKCHLDEEIRLEIEKQDAIKVSRETYMAQLRYLKTRVAYWLKKKKRKESITAEMFRNWLQEAKTKIFDRSLFVSCTNEIVTTGINFADSEISQLQAELCNKRAVHLRSDSVETCRVLLSKCLPESKCIYVNFKTLQNDKNKLLHTWSGGDWQWCVVFCDSEIGGIRVKDLCLFMFELIKLMDSYKCLICLTPISVKKIQGFSPIDHNFKKGQLSKKSQKRKKRALRALGADTVSRLVTEKTLNLEGTLHTNRGYNEPRVLEREVWLDVLRNPDMYPDIFLVSGMEVKDLAAIVPAGETVECIDQQNVHHIDFTQDTCSKFIEQVLSEADAEICFRKLCKKHTGKTLHWVHFKNGNLLWKKTHGDPVKLLNYIDTERTRLNKMCTEK